MTIGMRNRQALRKPVIPQPTPIQRRHHAELDRRIGAYVIGVLTVAILVGLVFDSFTHPMWWQK